MHYSHEACYSDMPIEQMILSAIVGQSDAASQSLSRLLSHCFHCEECQARVNTLLTMLTRSTQLRRREPLVFSLLTHLAAIFDQTLLLDYLPAYIDAIVEHGADQAAARFPIIAAHVHACDECQDDVLLGLQMVEHVPGCGHSDDPIATSLPVSQKTERNMGNMGAKVYALALNRYSL